MDSGTQNEDASSKPIPGPTVVGHEYLFEPDMRKPLSYTLMIGRFFTDLVRKPAHWVRANVVEPNRGPKYYWYHRKYPRALPIDECYVDDYPCMYEANLEYERNRKVDKATLELLRARRDNCYFWHSTDTGDYSKSEACKDIVDTFIREETNYHTKYGDLHFHATVAHAYNKQKHRMIVERRKAEKAKREQEEKSD